MGEEYSSSLSYEEWTNWVKRVRKWIIDHDIRMKDLSEITGYSVNTCYNALNSYTRCSRFFIAQLNERMRKDEKISTTSTDITNS
jgi:hypothetical protein